MRIYTYRFSLILLSSIIFGGIAGYFLGPRAVVLQPFGNIFLDLLFTIIVPLIFFSISTAIINVGEFGKLKKLFLSMMGVFLVTGAIAAIIMIIAVIVFPLAQDVTLKLPLITHLKPVNLGEQIAHMMTVPDITKLGSPDNMLALIVFSLLVGLAANVTGEKAKPFAAFLQSGGDVFMTLVTFVLYYAPIGFFAFFAVLTGKFGPALFHDYFRATAVYYFVGLVYFFIGFSCYAFIADRKNGLSRFWKNATLPSMTALATCSSAASIPVNLQAAKNMGIASEIYETVIPVGTVLNKQGSVLGGVVKIAFLFGLFHMNFLTPWALLSALIVAILVGTVMGAIPSGGMLGEMLILSWYGFPLSALFIIATISIIIDPLATVLNVGGNTVASLLVSD